MSEAIKANLIILSLIIFISLLGCTENQQRDSKKKLTEPNKPSETKVLPEIKIPQYSIIKKEVYDAPIKTQIALHVLISGEISEESIKNLLNKLFSQYSTAHGFKHHGGYPTHIFIYLYTSQAHYASGAGQWIGMLQKVGEPSPIEISVKEQMLAELNTPPKIIDGLDEPKRIKIYQELVFAERRAHKEAEAQYPIPNPSKPGYSPAKANEQIEKQMKTSDWLLERYRKEILKSFSINQEQMDNIFIEGIKREWPVPSN